MSNIRFRAVLLALTTVVCSTLSAETPDNPAILALKPIPQSNRIAPGASLTPQVQLSGHLPGWVTPSRQTTDPVDLTAPLRATIVLQRDPAVQAAFEQLLAAQQDPNSPFFHQWMTPQQIGDLFGPTPADVAAITNWLTAQGLTIASVYPQRNMIDVTGSTAAFAAAFHTGFAYFTLDKPRLSATSEPSIPAALAPVFRSISGLTDVPLEPLSYKSPGKTEADGSRHPLYTNGTSHFIVPADFAKIYDINSVYTSNNTGATIGTSTGIKPQHIAIIGRSNVATSDLTEFETNTGTTFATPNVVIPTGGINPGAVCTFANAATCSTGGDQGEQTLDVIRSLGTAPGAIGDLVIATNASGGIYLAASYNVSTLLDPIMTLSYGACEKTAGQTNVNTWDTLFSSAAGEGITVFVASGDSGVAGCEPYNGTPSASTEYQSINYICASSYATCAGGTEFNDVPAATYWGAGTGYGTESALSYIPEGAWNEPGTASPYDTSATGGGPSQYITKPTWQTGTGVPNDGYRDTPDISVSSAGHDGYYACLDFELGLYAGQGTPPISSADTCAQSGGGYFFGFSGTSAAAPSLAGITALLNTAAGKSQGNINPLLYKLAATTTNGAIHDATIATSGVTNCAATTPSICNNSTPLSATLTGGTAGYDLTTGYDESTGLGSPDVANFITAAIASYGTFTVTPASLAVTLPAGATTGNTDVVTLASVSSFYGSVALTCKVTTLTGTATGTCSFPTSPANIVTLTASGTTSTGTDTLTILPTAGTSGTMSVVVTGTIGITTVNSAAITVTVTNPTFSVTPASLALSIPAGAITGNTDSITLASVSGFVGTVTPTCVVTNVSGTAAGTCSLSPTSVALTAGGTGTSTLTILPNSGTSGTLSVVVTGTSGSTVVAATAIVVTVTAVTTPTFTLTPASLALTIPISATTGNTDSIALASANAFAGTVALTCAVSGSASGTCSLLPTSATLTSGGTGATVLTINPTAAGTLNVVVTGTSGSIVVSSATIVVTVPAPTFTLASSPSSLSFTSGATQGNTDAVTLASVNAFAGSVAITCSIAGASPTYPPTCTPSVTTVPLTSGGTGQTIITIGSTVAHAVPSNGNHASLGWKLTGEVALAMLLCLLPVRRRRLVRSLTLCGLLAIGLASISGCSGSSTPASTTPTLGSSAGTYTVTVTGTSGSTVQKTTFSLTIN